MKQLFLRGAFGAFYCLAMAGAALAQSRTSECETVLVFGTGTSASGALLRPATVDPFFAGASANFPSRGEAVVASPVPAGWLANGASGDSQWIAPTLDPNDSGAGTYVYRLQFNTPCAGAVVSGRYAAGDRGALRLNGARESFPTPSSGAAGWTVFNFSGLPAGANTLEFYVTNTPGILGADGPTGLRAELTVSATCCPCIVLNCPSDIFVRTCSNSAPVNFTITGTNRCYTNLTIQCRLGVAGANVPVSSGSLFAVGTNTVVCTASDPVGHVTNCTFQVVVAGDTRPPAIRCPRDIVYPCGVTGTNVFFEVPVVDDADPAPVLSCVPPSGSFFAAGTNTVLCEARDACGRISRCSFRVVLAPDGFTKVFQAGVADNFSAAGFEMPSAGPCLGLGGYWSGLPFDTSWPGRHASHSFQGLPGNITGARLVLNLKPTQPASQDDVLRIGLLNCGGVAQWAFAQALNAWPATGGVWNTNGPTVFDLDLAALPGGVNLLAQINSEQRLEYAVGTETMVDYARLAVTYCGPMSTLSGVPYSLQKGYPVHRGNGVSWRTVNSNDPPVVEIDGSLAEGLRFNFGDVDILPQCVTMGTHHGLSTVWPTGEGTTATLSIKPSPLPGLTRIEMAQPSNPIGKAIEVWNAGQLVTRYFLAGNGDTVVNVPTAACLQQMGFTTAYFFANFEQPVSVQILTGSHVSGQAGGIATGDTVRMYYVVTVSAPSATPKIVRVNLPPGGWSLAGMSFLHQGGWVGGFGPAQTTVSDAIISHKLLDFLNAGYGNCISAASSWTLNLQNPVLDFCTFDGVAHQCTGGHVDVNMKGSGGQLNALNFGGLRLTPMLLPLDVCRIENTVANSSANSVIIARPVGSPVTLNNVTMVEALHWPVKISGNAGPQSFVVDLPPNTTVTAGGQTYDATRVTFQANPLVLGEFYQVCLETVDAVQISMQNFIGPPAVGAGPVNCLTMNCPTGVVAVCTGGAGTAVSYAATAATRCGSNAVVRCEPPSGSLFSPGLSWVHCVATDSQGSRDECRFPVSVVDAAPPRLVAPARLIEPCTGPRGAAVTFTVSAVDTCDPAVVVECRPPSGSVFPVGTNRVTCTAVDAAGNRAVLEFPVIVSGGCATGGCLDLTVPDDREVRCNTPGGAVVNFAATAVDRCTGGAVTPVCVPASGSVFAVGLTRVVCTARSGGQEGSAAFVVEVVDDVAPEMECPPDFAVPAQSPRGAVVSFRVSARDDCAPSVRVRCEPASGSVFPVGASRVICEAADGNGNVGRCAFVVTVNPADPLEVQAGPGGSVVLRWVGDAQVEFTDELGDDPVWRPLPGVPDVAGVVRTLRFVPTAAQRFFRLQLLDLLPEGDADGDGVPDSRDWCARTPAGMAVDEHGCSLIELLTEPEDAIEPMRGRLAETVRQLVLDGTFSDLVGRISPELVNSNSPSAPLGERQPGRALTLQSNLVQALRGALADFQALKPRRIQELLRTRAAFKGDHADVRPQDFEIMRLEDIEAGLTEGLAESERTLNRLADVVRSLSTRERRTLRVESIDGLTGRARLSDGRLAVLPAALAPAAPDLDKIPCIFNAGSDVQVEMSLLPDGTWFTHLLTPSAGVSPDLVAKIDPRCLSLRVVPANPSLPDWDTGVRHRLKGYKWGFGTDDGYHFLEYGMALAVVKVGCVEPPEAYRHWVQLRVDQDNDGGNVTWVEKMDETSPPKVLKPTSWALPAFRVFPLIVRELRAPINADGSLGTSEVLGEQTYLIEMYPWGYFGTAEYSRTLFELPDRPYETAHQNAQVVDINRNFPLTLQSLGQQQFRAWSFTPVGPGSSYPNINPIVLNQGFAVHTQDPNDISFFAYTNDAGRGLYAPTLSGVNRGRPFTYRVSLPRIVRDRLHDCVLDSYYRIPLFGGWHVSQGNNGDFTHNGNQKYAFDFPENTGTFVLAARGGVVDSIRKTGCFSCWDPEAINEDGEEGDCVDCTGTHAGNFVKIRHQDGTMGVYVHFKKDGVLVTKNQRVYRGDILGKVGTTGCSTGPHLHFHVTENTDSSVTIPIRFETRDDDGDFRECYLPGHDSDGTSTNKPWFWP